MCMCHFISYELVIVHHVFCFSLFFCSPLYQAIMENPLVQLSLNNARVLGGQCIYHEAYFWEGIKLEHDCTLLEWSF